MLGALGAAVVCALAVVMTSNQINSKTEELAGDPRATRRAKQVADALRPYGQFADLQRARMTQIKTLAQPLQLGARAAPALEGDSAQRVAALGGRHPVVGIEWTAARRRRGRRELREQASAPSFTITGCTYSQHAVARMMIRMRNLDDVTEVHLASPCARTRATSLSSRTGAGAAGAGAGGDLRTAPALRV